MRIDGRKNDELRQIKFTHDFTKHALGSVLVEFGDTKVLVCANFEDSTLYYKDFPTLIDEILKFIINKNSKIYRTFL